MPDGLHHAQEPFGMPRTHGEPPMNFTRSFGYTLLAMRLRFLAGNTAGLTSAKRQAFAAIADGIEAGVCDDPEAMRAAIATVDLMESCR